MAHSARCFSAAGSAARFTGHDMTKYTRYWLLYGFHRRKWQRLREDRRRAACYTHGHKCAMMRTQASRTSGTKATFSCRPVTRPSLISRARHTSAYFDITAFVASLACFALPVPLFYFPHAPDIASACALRLRARLDIVGRLVPTPRSCHHRHD